MRELLAAVAVTLAGHVLCAAPVEWTFPRNGGCHEGLAFADGVTGVLVWGGGDTVNLTVGRADLWDHRGGCEWRDEWNYTNIVSRARQGDRAGLAALFKMEVKPGEPKNPQLLPLGRLVVRIPGAILRRGTLDPKTGLGSLVYETEKGLQTADLAMGRTSHAFVIRFPDDTGCEVKTVPSMEHAGLRDHLTSVGVDLPEQWRDDASGGFMWKLPVDDPVSLGWGLRGRELSVRTARTFERLSCCMTYDQVRGESLAQWKLFWERSAHVNVPDETLQQIYEYGLYRFGAMTDPEGVPAGLQGPWLEDDKLIPWNGDYHFNVNVQECYSPAFRSGHPERLLPLFRMIRTWWPRLRENARKFCGVEDGYMLPHAVDDRGTCIGGFWSGTIDHASTVWVADMMYRYAKYARDEAFLRTDAFPFMRGAMNVYLAMMEETADGKLCFPLGSSPEWGAMDGILVGYNPSFQLAAAHRLAKNLIEAAGRIGEPVDSRWSDVERRLPPYTASDGDGIQIFRDVGLKQSHRHHSHMAGFYPFDTIDVADPVNAGIAEETFRTWVRKGTGLWSGWCVPWASILHVHHGQAIAAVDKLHAWERYFTNGGHGSCHDAQVPGFTVMTGRNVMQMDGQCAAVTAILELMVHEVNGKTCFFRGCPESWREVSFENVRLSDGRCVRGRRTEGRTKIWQSATR